MKHLLLTLDYPPNTGGVARYLKALADQFGEDMIVISDKEKLISDKRFPGWVEAIHTLRSRKDYDHVMVSHVLPLGTAAMIAKWFTKKPYSVILHGMDFALAKRNPWKQFLTKQILRKSILVITNTKALEQEVKDFGIFNTLVAYPPVEVTGSNPGISERKGNRLLTVSRLVPRKGHLRVLEALKELPNHQYTIIGEGVMEDEIRLFIQEHNLEDRVHLAGRVTDQELAEHYQNADLFVMPTIDDEFDREGFGMVYLEAALKGLPSIASNLPGVDEAVIHNETGLLIPDGDENALKAAIQRLTDNPEERNRLAMAAYRHASHGFAPEDQFGKLRNHYE